MSQPIVYGDAISTYVRSVRLALEEKGVAHTLVAVDLVKSQQLEKEHLARHPWGKMPAFEHDGNSFYEASAIMRYVDEAFPGPALMPATPVERIRVNQVMSIVDSYGYPASITNIFIPRVLVPSLGGQTDEAQVEAAKPKAALFLSEITRLLGWDSYYGGATVSLADLHVLPVLAYLRATPEGQAMLAAAPSIGAWMARMNERSSVQAVMPGA
ncbi:glutathione S-transferase family protein [Accumulibacter sp.]|uniref:glutathione S-transferase family protein n=1 Tax=Accumulibacter sp. TaxID=2053492 RepID=UPI0028C4938A|nr:glutathione S-transferase family protein [Accumulibacter sp.]